MEDLEQFDVPPAPVHLSNSTDPFQPLEDSTGHTRCALEHILAHRRRFTTVTILTKNPLRPVKLGYSQLFRQLVELPPDHPRAEEFRSRSQPAFVVEVSLAFRRDAAREQYDPGVLSVAERIEGIRELARMQIPLVLRIDPLLPRSPLTDHGQDTLTGLELREAQTLDNLESLVAFAKEVGARHVVYSPMKIVKPRGPLSPVMQALRQAYQIMAQPHKLDFHGKSWRLPHGIAQARIVAPFLDICRRHAVRAKFCMTNLIGTP